MKAHLLFRDRDVNFTLVRARMGYAVAGPDVSVRERALIQDLELDTLLQSMARGDGTLFGISQQVMLSSLSDPEDIVYRQQALIDCIHHPDVIREMLAIAIGAVDGERKIWGSLFSRPDTTLRRSVEALQLFVHYLKNLRKVADDHADEFSSEGFATFFSMLKGELDDQYFNAIDDHLSRLKFKAGALMSARFGRGLKGTDYVLRTPEASKLSLKERFGFGQRTEYHWDLPPRDEAGARALGDLADRGVNLVANALAQSTDHIKSFFAMLWVELGFYVGCINLYEALQGIGAPSCMPDPVSWQPPELAFTEIYDPCLALRVGKPVVGNDADATGKSMVVITGANSGGKSTLLRGIGTAQLMMQAGMFVGALHYRASVTRALFSHFIREEDEGMKSGKLDEELARMSVMADELRPGCTVMFNESFAATNEREGAEIAAQIVRALLDADIKVLFVTHQFTLARYFFHNRRGTTLFLRAERSEDGRRTYKLREAEPLPTSFGQDLYRRIGGWTSGPAQEGS